MIRTAVIGIGTALAVISGPAQAQAHIDVGTPCPGYMIGSRDSGGMICDSNYTWQIYHGQKPSDPWVTQQWEAFRGRK
ncbi:MAG: hypothetical protein J2P17_01845 [Mycobacterium sp.]|nr:hypothetical protein [Mycobacterium sp.]